MSSRAEFGCPSGGLRTAVSFERGRLGVYSFAMVDDSGSSEPPWTVHRLLSWTQDYLAQRGVDEPRLATEVLLAHALGWKKIDLYTRFEAVPGPEERTAFRTLVQSAAGHTPIAYLVGEKEFFSLVFEVSPAVLVPRPETEALVERVLRLCAERGLDEPRFLEVGTGSGCISIAILTQLASAAAVATDISSEALAVAGRNADRHGVADRLALVEADRLNLPPEDSPAEGYDFLVSNPPYVTVAEMADLPRSVLDHEPAVALAAEDDGLVFYAEFAERGPAILRPEGSILVEIGYGKGGRVREIFERTARFDHVGTWRDPGDPHDRVMEFRLR
ncbi:MAG: peptide chain release factor N(5)-glutamine methyltransferase [bacterium]|nr:peptide chain release factor N(5)-glutamine methyltransferase [bacterium]